MAGKWGGGIVENGGESIGEFWQASDIVFQIQFCAPVLEYLESCSLYHKGSMMNVSIRDFGCKQ
jgi:hypothetical protein